MANYALRLPESLFAYARQVAEEEGVSMNQFFVTAIAEKVSARKTEAYFRERQARGDLASRPVPMFRPRRGIGSTRRFRRYETEQAASPNWREKPPALAVRYMTS
ncbi:hypothetical protein [Allochromatium palmeri]|uniref:hypothetical protein n=1 Tax=Allochromatium palmeri TaxID=231048 RepID=UPI001CA3BBAE|nr:hypothetical protein [Allochromatium palmeri]